MSADLLNGIFELGGALVLLLHVRRLCRDKQWRGISPYPFIWFLAWGYFNLYFYPSVGCWWSFFGGIAVVVVNTVYCYFLWYYRKG